MALEVMRRVPDSVRAVVLHGVVPLDELIPLGFPRAAQRALDGVLADCERPPLELRIEPRERGLAVHLPGDLEILFVPVAQDRFRPTGIPGTYLIVELDEEGRPWRLLLEEGGAVTLELEPAGR